MNALAISLILLSAVMHAGWNLICKSKTASAAFFILARTASITAMLPLYLYFVPRLGQVPAPVWKLLFTTGFFMALYDISLTKAYRRGDVSLVYPLTRSLPVLLVPCVCFLIGYGKPLSFLTVLGMIVIAIGCFILPLKPTGAPSVKAFSHTVLLCIVLASIGTTGYTIIDSMGLALLKEGSAHYTPVTAALLYVSFEYLFGMLFLIPYVACSRRERHQLRMLWRHSRYYPLMTGIAITSSYILVLLAMQFTTNVSYVVAFRQSSILLGVLLGIFILKEQATRFKIIGVVLIFAGLVLAGLG